MISTLRGQEACARRLSKTTGAPRSERHYIFVGLGFQAVSIDSITRTPKSSPVGSESILHEAKTISPLTATCIVVANMIGSGSDPYFFFGFGVGSLLGVSQQGFFSIFPLALHR